MTKTNTEAVEAAAIALQASAVGLDNEAIQRTWENCTDSTKDNFRRHARNVIAALSPTTKTEPSADVTPEQLNRIADFVSQNAPDYAKAIRRAAKALSAPTRERGLGEEFEKRIAQWDEDLSVDESGEATGTWEQDAGLVEWVTANRQRIIAALSAPAREREALKDAARTLHLAEQFIENGIEFGYIQMPDKDTPDAAHDMLPTIAKTSARIDNLLNEGSGR